MTVSPLMDRQNKGGITRSQVLRFLTLSAAVLTNAAGQTQHVIMFVHASLPVQGNFC